MHIPNSSKLGTAALLAACAAAGCSPVVASTGSHHVRTPDMSMARGAFAPAGQRVAVRLDQTVDTLLSQRRETFTARLQTPILDQNGAVFAPAGAVVYGHVASLGSRMRPRVRLTFDAVATAHGTRPLAAALRDAQYQRYPGPVEFVPGPIDYYGYYGAWGGGPAYVGWEPYQPIEVRLPANAELHLQLTRPIVANGP